MSDTNKANKYKAFFELIYKNFKLLKSEEDVAYHYWYGDKNMVIKLFKGMSFPSIKSLEKMGKLKAEKLLVLSMSNRRDGLFYGATILKLRSKEEAEMISFAVHPNLRNAGVGKKLMLVSFEMCKTLGLQSIYLKYRTYWKSNAHWEMLLDKTNWSQPQLHLWYFTMPDIKTQLDKEWIKNSKISEPYTVEEWSDSSMDSLKQTLALEKWQLKVPKALSPFQMPELVLPHVSMLLKKDNEIVGWLICHLLQNDIVQVTTVYIHPELGRGQGLKLMAEVAKRRKLGAQVIFAVEKHNEAMMKLVNKYFSGTDTHQYELRSRLKKI